MFKLSCEYAEKKDNLYTGKLIISLFGLILYEFPFVSGGWGRGYAPFGTYKIKKVDRIEDIKKNEAYKKEGFPWFAKIEPTFNTDRTGLGIHPDGNIYGTLGCIGVFENDMRLFFVLEILLNRFKELKLNIRRVV